MYNVRVMKIEKEKEKNLKKGERKIIKNRKNFRLQPPRLIDREASVL